MKKSLVLRTVTRAVLPVAGSGHVSGQAIPTEITNRAELRVIAVPREPSKARVGPQALSLDLSRTSTVTFSGGSTVTSSEGEPSASPGRGPAASSHSSEVVHAGRSGGPQRHS